jgi:hypothetical protein
MRHVEKYGGVTKATDYNILLRMRIACWITKAANTHYKYIILTAFSRQQWLRERASMFQNTYFACLVDYSYGYLNTICYSLLNVWSTARFKN